MTAPYCEENEIQHQMTTPYSTQQNGIVERKNYTILNMVQSIIKNKNLSKEFWAEVVACTIYILNRYPTTSLENKIHKKYGWEGSRHLAHEGLRMHSLCTCSEVEENQTR